MALSLIVLFGEAMITDHKKDVAELKAAVPQLTTERERYFVKSVIPTLEKHEKMALKLPKSETTSNS